MGETSTSINSEATSHSTVQIVGQILGSDQEIKLKVERADTLLEVMQKVANHFGKELLPNETNPLDRLHIVNKAGQVEPAIQDLAQIVEDFIHDEHQKRFGVELVLAFRVNARWSVAPKPSMSPREILALPEINLDYQSYTLYRLNSAEPLPLDIATNVTRGSAFEAQKDGKYGCRSRHS